MRTVANRRVGYDDPLVPQVLRRHRSAARPKFIHTNETMKLEIKQTEIYKKNKNQGGIHAGFVLLGGEAENSLSESAPDQLLQGGSPAEINLGVATLH